MSESKTSIEELKKVAAQTNRIFELEERMLVLKDAMESLRALYEHERNFNNEPAVEIAFLHMHNKTIFRQSKRSIFPIQILHDAAERSLKHYEEEIKMLNSENKWKLFIAEKAMPLPSGLADMPKRSK